MLVFMLVLLIKFQLGGYVHIQRIGTEKCALLKHIVPHILATVKNCGQHGLRKALLQVVNLSAIMREHLRPYPPAIFDVVEEFWFSRHLSALCSLVEWVTTTIPDDF